MEEYHARVCDNVPESGPAPKSTKVGLDQFALDYDLSDMMDLSGCDLSSDEQTVNDEFVAYMAAKFKKTKDPDEDILLFWKVSICTMHFHSRLGFTLHRSMKPHSPHYTQLHSTIYLSRHQQFHVSAFSLRARKRTQSGAIKLILSSWRPCKLLSSL
jgi:hypothetical protein